MKRASVLPVIFLITALISGCSSPKTSSIVSANTSAPSTTYPAYEKVIRDYWAAFNSFDLDKCVSYLDPTYAQTRKAGIQSELDQFQLGRALGVKMVVDSVSPPVTSTDGQLEVQVTMKISPRGLSDDRYLIYTLVQVNGELKISRQRDNPDKTPPHSSPENLKAEVISANQVNLVWDEKSSRETGVLLERASEKTFKNDLVNIKLPQNSNNYSDTDVIPGATYFYRVSVFNNAGSSSVSAVVKVILPLS